MGVAKMPSKRRFGVQNNLIGTRWPGRRADPLLHDSVTVFLGLGKSPLSGHLPIVSGNIPF